MTTIAGGTGRGSGDARATDMPRGIVRWTDGGDEVVTGTTIGEMTPVIGSDATRIILIHIRGLDLTMVAIG